MANQDALSVYVMYVRSEPHESPSSAEFVPTPPARRLVGLLAPPILLEPSPRARTETLGGPTLELPSSEAQCVRLVLDLARRAHRSVRVVDVSNPSKVDDGGLLRPGSEESFPILVAPNGERLSGEPAFTPAKVRGFLKRG